MSNEFPAQLMTSVITRINRTIRREAADLGRDGRGWILFSISAGWFLSIGVRVVFPALLPYFESEFDMSLTAAGLLITVLWGAYAFGQFPGGVLGDRYGERNMLVFSTAISTVAVIAVASAHNTELLFAGTIAFGFATALFGPLRFTIFTHVFPERTGTAVGITMAAGNVGNAVLPIIAGGVAAYAAWQYSFWLVAPLFAVTTAVMWFRIPARDKDQEPKSDITIASVRAAGREVIAGIRQRGIPSVTAVQVIMAIAYQGFVGFYPTYLISVKGVSPALATTLFGMFFASAIVVQPLVGTLQDRIGSKPTLLTIVAMFFVALLGLWYATALPALVGLTLLASSRTGTGVINNTFIASALPEDVQASALGFLRTGWIAIGALAPVAIGALGDQGALKEGFLLLAIAAGIGLLFVLFIPKTSAQGD